MYIYIYIYIFIYIYIYIYMHMRVSDRQHTFSVCYELLIREPSQYGITILQHFLSQKYSSFLVVKSSHHTCLPVASNMVLYNTFSTLFTVDG